MGTETSAERHMADSPVTERSDLTAVPAWEAGAVVAAMVAETRSDPRELGWEGRSSSPNAAIWLQALAQERAQVERAVAELQRAYLAHPEDVELARQLGRIAAVGVDLDARAAFVQEIL